jgi:ABC-type polysaccharide/polyol phosphate export permease
MAVVVTSIQTALVKGTTPPLDPILSATGIALAVFVAGWTIFRRLQYEIPKFA